MDRYKFITALNKASCQLDKRRFRNLIKRSVDSCPDEDIRGKHNLIIVMEELAELTQQVSKTARGKRDKIGVLEEMADVSLALAYLQDICGITTLELYQAMNVKLDRLEKVLDERRVYQ